MAYTKELIDEVKELYPNSTKMHELAEQGNAFLGRYLDDSSPRGIPIDAVLLATSLEELQKKQENINARCNSIKNGANKIPVGLDKFNLTESQKHYCRGLANDRGFDAALEQAKNFLQIRLL